MGAIEVADQLKGCSAVYVASESFESLGGAWPFDFILGKLNSNPSMSPSTLGKTIVSKYGTWWDAINPGRLIGLQNHRTMSSVDTSEVYPLVLSLNAFASQALASTAQSDWDALRSAGDAAANYSLQLSPGEFENTWSRDLRDFLNHVAGSGASASIKTAAANAIIAFDAAIISNYHSIWDPGAGLDICIPSQYRSIDPKYLGDLKFFSEATRWGEFLGRLTDERQPPTAALTVSNIKTGGGTACTFTVTYTDNAAVDTATLDNSDIQVTGPNGFNQSATFVEVNVSGNGTPRTATYRINAPGGAWDASDNGTYTVSMQSDQVTDTNGNAVKAGTLESFQVAVGASVGLTSPNGGEAWWRGTTQTISWTAANPSEQVRIDLYKGGSYYDEIVLATNNRSYPWEILRTLYPAGNDYQVNITSTSHPSNYDCSNSKFTTGAKCGSRARATILRGRAAIRR
jgi:hypothetical protein